MDRCVLCPPQCSYSHWNLVPQVNKKNTSPHLTVKHTIICQFCGDFHLIPLKCPWRLVRSQSVSLWSLITERSPLTDDGLVYMHSELSSPYVNRSSSPLVNSTGWGILPSAPFCILMGCVIIFSHLLHLFSSHPTHFISSSSIFFWITLCSLLLNW